MTTGETTMGSTPQENADGAAKVLGALLALMAVIAGVYAMVRPMDQRIDQLQLEVASLRSLMTETDRYNVQQLTNMVSDLSALKEKFSQVVVQTERIKAIDEWRTWTTRNELSQIPVLKAQLHYIMSLVLPKYQMLESALNRALIDECVRYKKKEGGE
jgi:TolA-binding protein